MSTGPTLLTFDNDGFLWSSLSYSNEILRVEPSMVIPGIELNGMLKIKLTGIQIFFHLLDYPLLMIIIIKQILYLFQTMVLVE